MSIRFVSGLYNSLRSGFRPAFRFYSPWLSLVGAVMCVLIMFIMSWPTTLLTFTFFIFVFAFIKHLKPGMV